MITSHLIHSLGVEFGPFRVCIWTLCPKISP